MSAYGGVGNGNAAASAAARQLTAANGTGLTAAAPVTAAAASNPMAALMALLAPAPAAAAPAASPAAQTLGLFTAADMAEYSDALGRDGDRNNGTITGTTEANRVGGYAIEFINMSRVGDNAGSQADQVAGMQALQSRAMAGDANADTALNVAMIFASAKGSGVNYNNGEIQEILQDAGSKYADADGVGDTDVESLGAVVNAIADGELTEDQIQAVKDTADNQDTLNEIAGEVSNGDFEALFDRNGGDGDDNGNAGDNGNGNAGNGNAGNGTAGNGTARANGTGGAYGGGGAGAANGAALARQNAAAAAAPAADAATSTAALQQIYNYIMAGDITSALTLLAQMIMTSNTTATPFAVGGAAPGTAAANGTASPFANTINNNDDNGNGNAGNGNAGNGNAANGNANNGNAANGTSGDNDNGNAANGNAANGTSGDNDNGDAANGTADAANGNADADNGNADNGDADNGDAANGNAGDC